MRAHLIGTWTQIKEILSLACLFFSRACLAMPAALASFAALSPFSLRPFSDGARLFQVALAAYQKAASEAA